MDTATPDVRRFDNHIGGERVHDPQSGLALIRLDR